MPSRPLSIVLFIWRANLSQSNADKICNKHSLSKNYNTIKVPLNLVSQKNCAYIVANFTDKIISTQVVSESIR